MIFVGIFWILINFCFRHDFKLVFNVDIQTTMSKGDRLIYGESSMTHAMVFTGCSTDVSLFLPIFKLSKIISNNFCFPGK